MSLAINKDIEIAKTLQSSFYRDQHYLDISRELIFAKSWQFLCNKENTTESPRIKPLTLLPGFLNEPLLLTKNSLNQLNCFANVCTHRGNLLVETEERTNSIRCRYHGRKFDLNGDLTSCPGFERAKNFPQKSDNLFSLDSKNWGPLTFVNLNAEYHFDELINPMKERLSFLDIDKFAFDKNRSKDYLTNANWALYVENYLEGFHIPYVHPALAASLDCQDYKTELYEFSNLQIGISKSNSESFELPKDHIDYGKNVAAYYFWLFPNMMFNFYPWGLSLNIVCPLKTDQTRISYLTYIYDQSKLNKGAGANVDRTELEDQAIIEQVQKGINSRFYKEGRYSPDWEEGPHHFHRLLSKFLN